MDDIKFFILNKMPAGAIVFNQELDIIFCNRQAELFFKRYKLPDEIRTICRKIFDAIRVSKLKELFPGEIHLLKKLEGSPSHWLFRVHVCEEPKPFVAVFIVEESFSNKIDLNRIRAQFRLTRREMDVLRHMLNGLKNIDIADDLEISEQTIKDHLSSIYMKLRVENRFTLVRFLLSFAESQKDN